MDWHSKTVIQVIKHLNTMLTEGLSDIEAEDRLLQHGENKLEEGKQQGFFIKLLLQFKDFMVIILIIAAVISLITAVIDGSNDYSEPILIMVIVLFNGIVGVIQESKAEKALQALQAENPKRAIAVRGGQAVELPIKQLVPGDIIHIKQGDIVPADCRICDCMGLSVSESNLTGESEPIEKSSDVIDTVTPLAERKNMVYMGTQVMAGSGVCVVVATGMFTEMGKIADMLTSQQQSETPLQKRLGETGKVLGWGALAICLVIFVMGIMQNRPVMDMLMTSVSLAVAAIPEGLPAIVTVMLAIGVQAMAKENAVVRRLSAVEALGSATVICTDKTGTLTKNKIRVNKIYGFDEEKIVKAAAFCVNVEKGDGDKWLGDPTETAITDYTGFCESNDFPRIAEIPFTSERKMMTSINSIKGKYIAISKGAPEIVLEKCCSIMYKTGEKNLDKAERKKLSDICDNYQRDGLRVLAVAYRTLEKLKTESKSVEKDLCFLGLLAMRDEPREEAADAVSDCKNAGIRTVMITGDSPLTAKAIGESVGIVSDRVGLGVELENMDESQVRLALSDTNIFARVSPSHKLKIVNALKSKGEIVAMTGDACNDAPALKAADIGCAMGLCGTQVAREAADIVLMDDNFATIVKAVACGRGIFSNIKKAVHFLLSSNVGEIITVFSSMCCSYATPLAPVQLLWINLITDSLPAIALGLEPTESDVMKYGQNRQKSLFGAEKWTQIAVEGMMIGLLALLAGGVGKIIYNSADVARTMTFATLSISQLVHAFNMRSENTSLFKLNIFENKWLVGAFVVGCLLQCGVIGLPLLNTVFQVTTLTVNQWLWVAGLCLVPIVVVELEKLGKH